jgi:hypothetical protein
VSKSSGKRLLNDCYELFGADAVDPTETAEALDTELK